MAPIDSSETHGGTQIGTPGDPAGAATRTDRLRRKASRTVVPVAVAGVAAATIGLVPALADSGDPDLPKITARELVAKIAASDTQRLSGTVKIATDLGIPSLAGLAGSLGQGAGASSGAAPEDRLTELASGTHTLKVAADGPDKQRLTILQGSSEYSLIHNGDQVWAYDSGSDEVFHAETGAAGHTDSRSGGAAEGTPQQFADEALKAVGDTTSVTVDGTVRVAGRDAYQLLIKPKQSGSTVGSVRIAVDADNGVPLRFTLSPSSGGKAAVNVGFTKVDFGKPAASAFDFTPPKGAKVTEAGDAADQESAGQGGGPLADLLPGGLGGLEGTGGAGSAGSTGNLETKTLGEGWTTILRAEVPGGEGLSSAKGSSSLLDAFGDKASGKFGSGTVFSTRLVNALVTDQGKVYVGAVTRDALVRAANADR
ncbi:outer membrane lipoprotein carrier protein LolA [Streptomyces sp. NPDC060198]|uniref:LolA family protein n=1 Tax=Streptomyces sp. NPDC060198 TaxID=3347070 RepID=UPI00365C61A2